jgi:hypothetical protein
VRFEKVLRKRDVKCIRKDSDPERKKEKDRERRDRLGRLGYIVRETESEKEGEKERKRL